MKVGIFVDAYVPEINGVVTATKTLFDILNARGDDAYVITTNPFNNKTIMQDKVIRIPGIRLKHLYDYRVAWIYNYKAVKMIKRIHFDVIHVQTEASLGIFGRILAKKFDIPVVYTYHTMYIDYTYYVTKGFLDPLAKNIVKKFSKAIADISTEFTTTSEKTKNALRSYGIKKYINVIPNGINIEAFNKTKYTEEDFMKYRKEHGVEDSFLILSVGRLAKEKSLDVCLKEYAIFLKENPNLKTNFIVVGDGPARQELEKLAMDLGILGNVIFVGKVSHEETSFFYNMCDLYISASTTETQGLTFIEAMSANLLVLCQYDDNLNEVVIDKKTGFYFYSEKECHEKLKYVVTLAKDEKEKIVKNAFENVQKFSMDIYYDRMKEVYHRAIRKRW